MRTKKYQTSGKVGDAYTILLSAGIINPTTMTRDTFSRLPESDILGLMSKLPRPNPNAEVISSRPVSIPRIEEVTNSRPYNAWEDPDFLEKYKRAKEGTTVTDALGNKFLVDRSGTASSSSLINTSTDIVKSNKILNRQTGGTNPYQLSEVNYNETNNLGTTNSTQNQQVTPSQNTNFQGNIDTIPCPCGGGTYQQDISYTTHPCAHCPGFNQNSGGSNFSLDNIFSTLNNSQAFGDVFSQFGLDTPDLSGGFGGLQAFMDILQNGPGSSGPNNNVLTSGQGFLGYSKLGGNPGQRKKETTMDKKTQKKYKKILKEQERLINEFRRDLVMDQYEQQKEVTIGQFNLKYGDSGAGVQQIMPRSGQSHVPRKFKRGGKAKKRKTMKYQSGPSTAASVLSNAFSNMTPEMGALFQLGYTVEDSRIKSPSGADAGRVEDAPALIRFMQQGAQQPTNGATLVQDVTNAGGIFRFPGATVRPEELARINNTNLKAVSNDKRVKKNYKEGYKSSVDNEGLTTRDEVIGYQKALGLTGKAVDGIWGPQTQRAYEQSDLALDINHNSTDLAKIRTYSPSPSAIGPIIEPPRSIIRDQPSEINTELAKVLSLFGGPRTGSGTGSGTRGFQGGGILGGLLQSPAPVGLMAQAKQGILNGGGFLTQGAPGYSPLLPTQEQQRNLQQQEALAAAGIGTRTLQGGGGTSAYSTGIKKAQGLLPAQGIDSTSFRSINSPSREELMVQALLQSQSNQSFNPKGGLILETDEQLAKFPTLSDRRSDVVKELRKAGISDTRSGGIIDIKTGEKIGDNVFEVYDTLVRGGKLKPISKKQGGLGVLGSILQASGVQPQGSAPVAPNPNFNPNTTTRISPRGLRDSNEPVVVPGTNIEFGFPETAQDVMVVSKVPGIPAVMEQKIGTIRIDIDEDDINGSRPKGKRKSNEGKKRRKKRRLGKGKCKLFSGKHDQYKGVA